jgi:hypothetical protein
MDEPDWVLVGALPVGVDPDCTPLAPPDEPPDAPLAGTPVAAAIWTPNGVTVSVSVTVWTSLPTLCATTQTSTFPAPNEHSPAIAKAGSSASSAGTEYVNEA